VPVALVEERRQAHWYLPGTTDGLRARKAKAASHQINPIRNRTNETATDRDLAMR